MEPAQQEEVSATRSACAQHTLGSGAGGADDRHDGTLGARQVQALSGTCGKNSADAASHTSERAIRALRSIAHSWKKRAPHKTRHADTTIGWPVRETLTDLLESARPFFQPRRLESAEPDPLSLEENKNVERDDRLARGRMGTE